jgi:hypothetical protein
MGIIYDLPRIGKEEEGFKQKGPTCWYYASKMLLKFHDKLSDKSSQTYMEFKKLHQLRRGMTALSSEERALRSDKKEVKATLEGLKKLLPTPVSGNGFYAEHVKKISAYLDADNLKLDEAIKVLDQIEGDWSERLSLLDGFVPTAGFKRLDSTSVFASATSLEDALRQNGPMYLSGSLSISAKAKSNPDPTTEQMEFAETMFGKGVLPPMEKLSIDKDKTYKVGKVQSSGDELLEVKELKADSAHAVAVCGVEGESVFYKDPNGSHKLLSLPFDKIKPNVKSVIALTCSSCTHKVKTLMLTT